MIVLRRILLGIGTLALVQLSGWGQSSSLLGDAFILPGNANNYGGTVTVNVGGVSGFQGLFQFDLSTLPAGTTAASVSSASLRLFVNRVSAAGGVNVYAATSSWSESTVNGISAPLPGALVAGPISVTVPGSYLSIPVTGQVQAWLTGAPNNGFLIQASPSTTSVFFDSKESASTSHQAVLEVVLTPPAGANGAPGAQGPTGATGATGPVGATGPQGDTGATGTSGLAGAAGAVGPIGAPGPQGVTGAPGTTGLAGAAGAAGVTGPAGPQGSPGATGAAGTAGAAGAAGARGNTGPQGLPGVTGAAGVAGPQGLILNSFAISSVQPAGAVSSALTQAVILVNNTSPGNVNITLPSAGPGTTGKDIWIDGNDFSANGNSFSILAASGDDIIVHCTPQVPPVACNPFTTFGPIGYKMNLVSDGNHHWYPVSWH
jgi:hypothetical protein